MTTKTRKPVTRSFNFKPAHDGLGNRITITVGKDVCTYLVSEIGCDIGGRGFQLDKLDIEDPATYCVHLDGPMSTCECMGHLRHGCCKHVDALLEAEFRGLLPGSVVLKAA